MLEQIAATRNGYNRLRILVAEDNHINQHLAVKLLEHLGHTAVVVENGKEAVAAAQKGPFDLVFMDVQMPEMDGLEATATIRAQETTGGPHIPIVAMTAHAMIGDREQCLKAGMDGYLSKPISAQQLSNQGVEQTRRRRCVWRRVISMEVGRRGGEMVVEGMGTPRLGRQV